MMTQATTTATAETVERLAAEVATLEAAAQQRDFARRLAFHRGDAPALATINAAIEIGAAKLTEAQNRLTTARADAEYAAWRDRDRALHQELADLREAHRAQVGEIERTAAEARDARKRFDLTDSQIQDLSQQIARHSQDRPERPAERGIAKREG